MINRVRCTIRVSIIDRHSSSIIPRLVYASYYPELASDVDFIQPLQLQLDRNHLSPQHLSIFLRPIPSCCPALLASTMQIREILDTMMLF